MRAVGKPTKLRLEARTVPSEGGTNRREEEEKEEEEEESASEEETPRRLPTPVPARSYADLGCALTNASVSSVVLVDRTVVSPRAPPSVPPRRRGEAAANSKGVGSASPGCRSSRSPRSCARRASAACRSSSPIRKPRRYSVAARRFAPRSDPVGAGRRRRRRRAEASEGKGRRGTTASRRGTTPLRNVPVVMTTAGAQDDARAERRAADDASPMCCRRGSLQASARFDAGWTETGSTSGRRRRRRSAPRRVGCDEAADGGFVQRAVHLRARAADRGALEALRTRNWMPAASAATPMRPSRASISRTSAPCPGRRSRGCARAPRATRPGSASRARRARPAAPPRRRLRARVAPADDHHVERAGRGGRGGTARRRGRREKARRRGDEERRRAGAGEPGERSGDERAATTRVEATRARRKHRAGRRGVPSRPSPRAPAAPRRLVKERRMMMRAEREKSQLTLQKTVRRRE